MNKIAQFITKKYEDIGSLMVMEACVELTHEVSKFKLGGVHNLVEEISDMYICLEFMKDIANIKEEDIEKMIDIKCNRMIERVKENKFK